MRTQIILYLDPESRRDDAIITLFPLGHECYVETNLSPGQMTITFEVDPVTADIEEYINYLLKRNIIFNASYNSPPIGFTVNETGQRTSGFYVFE